MNTLPPPSLVLARILALLTVLASLATVPVQARVGETQEQVEKRILAPNVGRIYPKSEAAVTRGGRGGMAGGARGGTGARGGRGGATSADPFGAIRSFLPAGLVEVVYLKTDNSAAEVVNLVNPDTCWHVHVLYAAGRSAMEAYVRIGTPITEFEINGLLSLNKGAQAWKRMADVVPAIESGIEADYVLDDGSLRAKEQGGSTLLVFAAKVDTYVLEQQAAAKAVSEKTAEQQKKADQAKAPTSLIGL